jgi:hypothetical protein
MTAQMKFMIRMAGHSLLSRIKNTFSSHELQDGYFEAKLYEQKVVNIQAACFSSNCPLYFPFSRDSSVGIALGYGLDDRGSRVRFSAGAGNFSLYHRIQNGSGAHSASYPMDTRGSFPGSKAAEA